MPDTPVANMPDTRYVNGETRYIKIQKPGSWEGVARTPQKIRHREKSKLAMLPPVSASSIPAIIICANVEVKRRKDRINRNIKAPRSWTALVGSAFWYRPMG